ncbi:MAG TPA: hypothetical protein VFS21_17020 [Roseiflexaceae bacterium]|nr:hypothetical protein [Roseiflexaceae bacterium]
MKHLLILALFAVLLAGCGTTTGGQGNPAATVAPAATATPVALTPDEVHTTWVHALRDNDRQTAFPLVTVENQQYVDRSISEIQNMIASTAYGAFTGVEALPTTDLGAGKVGLSRWSFEQRSYCYQLNLAEVEAAWQIVDWERVPCP